MTWTAFFLILASVLLHAGWNFISKTGRPTIPFFCIFSFSILMTTLPLNLLSGVHFSALPLTVFGCAAGAGLCGGILFDVGMSFAYRSTDISVSYPLTRALPVLMTIAVTLLLGIGQTLTALSVTGMTVTFCGCVLTGFAAFSAQKTSPVTKHGITGILLAASGITGYTVFDSIGIRAIVEAAPEVPRLFSAGCYSNMRELGAFSFLLVLTCSRPQLRREFVRQLRSWHPYMAGFCAAVTYLLVLLAMPYVTNVSYVQAFRQISLPVGVLLGVLVLKEKVSRKHAAGIALILIGLVITALR